MDAIESFIAVADWVFAFAIVALAFVWWRTRRRPWAIAAGVLLVTELAFLWSKHVEPRFVEVTHERLPLAKEPLRVVAFSDLHAGRMNAEDLARAVTLANAERPDVVLLAGDFISGYSLTDERRQKLEGLRGLVAKGGVLAVLGNHDSEPYGDDTPRSEAITKLLEGFGYRVLRNEGVMLAPDVWLGGVDEFQAQKSDAARAFASAPAESKRIALAHDWHALDTDVRFDLGLVGHTHGGQVCVPFTSACAGPRRDQPYVRGRHAWRRGGVLYVTRGIGMSKVTLRFGCRPEVTVWDLGR